MSSPGGIARLLVPLAVAACLSRFLTRARRAGWLLMSCAISQIGLAAGLAVLLTITPVEAQDLPLGTWSGWWAASSMRLKLEVYVEIDSVAVAQSGSDTRYRITLAAAGYDPESAEEVELSGDTLTFSLSLGYSDDGFHLPVSCRLYRQEVGYGGFCKDTEGKRIYMRMAPPDDRGPAQRSQRVSAGAGVHAARW